MSIVTAGPEPELDAQAIEAFYNGKTGIGQASHTAGYKVLNFLTTCRYTYDLIRRAQRDKIERSHSASKRKEEYI